MRKKRHHRTSHPSSPRFIIAEALELRRLLSTVSMPQATPLGGPAALSEPGSSMPVGLSPSQIRSVYGINNISFNGVTGDGAGQTIAIIVAHDNPDFVDTGTAGFNTSDLHIFDQQFGLPDPPSFMKVDQNGGTSYPSSDPGWANEIALDVEWTHAIAPSANILLVECDSTNPSELIEGGAYYASTVAGVSVVTMSFALSEFSGETSYDSFLESPSSTHGVTFVAASGDGGIPGNYPAFSPNVLAVGDTSLTISGSNYVSESGYFNSGGGVSTQESKPSYQYGLSQSLTQRTIPDVSIDGDPNTGISVYDSFNGGSTPWYKVGGTSFSAPAWAGLIAIADQGRASENLPSLDGLTQTLPSLYSLPSADFHDVTSGNNGDAAGTGYDLVTGLGTPIANKLIPDLAGGNSIKGKVFVDSNGDGTQDNGETALAGVEVFTDIYKSGLYEGNDVVTTTASDGTFDLTDVPGGTYRISIIAPPGYRVTTSTNLSSTVDFDSTTTGINFGVEASSTPSKLAFVQQSSSATAGTVLTPAFTVDVDDSSGSVVLSDDSPVTLSVSTGSAILTGTVTVDAVKGVATFNNLGFLSPGTDTLVATDGSLTSTTSGSIAVAGNPTSPAGSVLVFGQQPTNGNIGVDITPAVVVDVESAAGQILTSDASTVTLTVANGPGSLSGSETATAVDGVATFSDVTLSAAGTYTLSASDGSLTPVTSSSFIVTAVPTELGFAQQPAPTNAGAVISPAITVDVNDGGGNLVTTDNSPVTLTLAGGSGVLGGTLTENAVNGVATFSDITVSVPGVYTLNASDGALTAVTSSSFSINTPGVIQPTITRSTLAASLVAGSKSHATVVVNETNISPNISTGSVTTDVYATVDGQQNLLGSIVRKATVKAKKSQVITVPIKLIPADLTGTYTLQVVVTDSKLNTQTAGDKTVAIAQPFTSLAEGVTKLTLPASVVGGSTVHGSALVKITNIGNIPSSGITTTRLYASPDGTVNSAELLNAVTRTMTIKAGGSVVVAVPLKQIPITLSGTLQILAEVADPNAVRTSVNTGKTLSVGAASVDLVGTFSVPTPASAAAGKTIGVTLTIQNNGNVASTGSATLVLGLSADKATAEPGTTTTVHPETIPAGKSIVLHLKITVPTGLAAGSYFPFATFTQPLAAVTVAGTTAVTVT